MTPRRAALLVAFCAFFGSSITQAQTIVAVRDMDSTVKPGADFYRYANGNWLKSVAYSPGERTYDIRTMLKERTSQRVRGVVENAANSKSATGSIAQKVGDFYASLIDEQAIEAKGMSPLNDEMARIAAISDKTSLSAYLGSTLASETDGLTANADHVFGVWVNQSFTDPRRCVFHLLQGGLGMPDRDSYLSQSSEMTALRSQYRKHIANTLALGGFKNSESKAAGILSLEIRIAQAHAPDSDAADVFKQNNPWKRSDFDNRAPGMDWKAYFEAAGVNQEPEFVIWQPSAVAGVSALVASESLDAWKDYLRFHLIEHFASVLPRSVAEEDFAFYGKTLAGSEKMPERSEVAIGATNGALGQAVGQLYVHEYFPPAAKAEAQAMAANLLTAYRARISNLTWMSPQTKGKALAKLAALRLGLGYPDKWIDYTTLDVVRGDAFGNMHRAEAFYHRRNLALLRQPADPDEWRIDPQVAGAVIVFSPNTETFSAGILQPPYFDWQGDAASNYGSAGAGMAHEISHSFDELGNIYDDQGRLGMWWTAEDLAKYREEGVKLAAQFDRYCPLPDACLNGKQVLSESMADLAGLLVAHDAYILSSRGKPDLVINGLTGDQRFFLAFSQRWRRVQSEAALRRQIKTDTHPPGEYRSDTVRNLDAWYKAFQVMPADKLYLKPEDRVKIW